MNPKVTVIGGGFAGLVTAYRLHNSGIDVDLYEARNRVGGRVFTASIHGKVVELGAQNLSDGGEMRHLKQLIDELDLDIVGGAVPFENYYYDGTSYVSFKSLIQSLKMNPEELRRKLTELASDCTNMKEVLDTLFDPNDPLYKSCTLKLAGYEGAHPKDLSTICIETLYYILLGGLAPVHQVGYFNLTSIKGGNSLLAEKIAESLGARVHLNMPLTGVKKEEEGSYLLTFRNGEQCKTSHLVLAMPCSVYEDISFGPGVIPQDKLNHIQNVAYGINAKIIVPMLKPHHERIGIMYKEAGSFFDYPLEYFTIYYTGESSKFTPKTIAERYAEFRPAIEMGMKKNTPPFETPVYGIDAPRIDYNSPLGYSWPNDPYVKGSYSYISEKQATILSEMITIKGETFRKLFTPIDDRLYFAGEHTTILVDVCGTMEAACESGERIAHSIKTALEKTALEEQLPLSR